MVYFLENPLEMDDFGVPPFSGNLDMFILSFFGMIMVYQKVPVNHCCTGAEVSNIGDDYKKSMPYMNVFEMQKP